MPGQPPETESRVNGQVKSLPTCARCGHSPDWHRHDDADNTPPTDPACTFRCIGYDCTAPGPVPSGGRACNCPDYVNPFDEHTRMWADEIIGGTP